MARRAMAAGTLACWNEMREIAAQGCHPGDLLGGDGGVGDSMDVWHLCQGHLCGAGAGRVCKYDLEVRVAGRVRCVCAVFVRQSEACRCVHGSVKAVPHLVQFLAVCHGVSNLVHHSLDEADSCLRQVVVLSVVQQISVHALVRRPATASP